MAELTITDRVTVPDGVIARELDGETVLLNLDTGIYFGLDAVGTDMWRAIQDTGSVEGALRTIEAQYDADPAVLRRDLLRLVNRMLTQGLLQPAA